MKKMHMNCPRCGTPAEDAPGIGPFCPNTECDAFDDMRPVGSPPVIVTARYPVPRREDVDTAYAAGFRDALSLAASVVRNWSLPTLQTPSMWLIDKAGIEADILAIPLPARNGE